MNIVEALVAFILTIPIAWNYFKLVLEMAERYVVIGVMYYTMPLACVPIVSKILMQSHDHGFECFSQNF